MSKLYTKEMFLIAAEKCEVSMIDARHIMQYIDEYVTPIELPTLEDIELKSVEYSTHTETKEFYKDCCWDFQNGAKWLFNKIKGGQE